MYSEKNFKKHGRERFWDGVFVGVLIGMALTIVIVVVVMVTL